MIGEILLYLAGIALVIGVTIALFGVVSWIRAKREQHAMEPKDDEYQKMKQASNGYKKRTRKLGWLWTILVLALLGFIGWKLLLPMISSTIAASRGYPICADAETMYFNPEDGITLIEVEIRPECWSGWVVTPIDWRDYYFQNVEKKGFEIMFRDGYREWIGPTDTPFYENKRGIFRFRGEGKIIVSIEGGSEE